MNSPGQRARSAYGFRARHPPRACYFCGPVQNDPGTFKVCIDHVACFTVPSDKRAPVNAGLTFDRLIQKPHVIRVMGWQFKFGETHADFVVKKSGLSLAGQAMTCPADTWAVHCAVVSLSCGALFSRIASPTLSRKFTPAPVLDTFRMRQCSVLMDYPAAMCGMSRSR